MKKKDEKKKDFDALKAEFDKVKNLFVTGSPAESRGLTDGFGKIEEFHLQ